MRMRLLFPPLTTTTANEHNRSTVGVQGVQEYRVEYSSSTVESTAGSTVGGQSTGSAVQRVEYTV